MYKFSPRDKRVQETLKTGRLTLRRFCRSDYRDVYEYASNPAVGINAGWPPHRTHKDSKRLVKELAASNRVWAVVYSENGKVIGSIGFHPDKKRSNPRAMMLGYAISEDYWGRGLATEAAKAVIHYGFTSLMAEIITIYHYSHNVRTKRVIEKCGFRHEGTLKNASLLFDGNLYDNECYSLTRGEYLESL